MSECDRDISYELSLNNQISTVFNLRINVTHGSACSGGDGGDGGGDCGGSHYLNENVIIDSLVHIIYESRLVCVSILNKFFSYCIYNFAYLPPSASLYICGLPNYTVLFLPWLSNIVISGRVLWSISSPDGKHIGYKFPGWSLPLNCILVSIYYKNNWIQIPRLVLISQIYSIPYLLLSLLQALREYQHR